MADNTHVHEVLNELLAAEARSLLPRLLEVGVFVDFDEADDLEALRRMVVQQQEDRNRLAQTLIDLDGEPGLGVRDISSASFHYVELPVLMPRIIACQEQLVERYGRAVKALADCPPAAEAVRDVADRRRSHLEYLRKIAAAVASG